MFLAPLLAGVTGVPTAAAAKSAWGPGAVAPGEAAPSSRGAAPWRVVANGVPLSDAEAATVPVRGASAATAADGFLVPLWTVAQALGVQAEWSVPGRKAVVRLAGQVVLSVRPGIAGAEVRGKVVRGPAPIARAGRLLVPLGVLRDALGLRVTVDEAARSLVLWRPVPLAGLRVEGSGDTVVLTLPAPAGFTVRWPQDGAVVGRGGRVVLDLPGVEAAVPGVARGDGVVRLVRSAPLPGEPPSVRVVVDLAEGAPWQVASAGGIVRLVARHGEDPVPVSLLSAGVAEDVYAGAPAAAPAEGAAQGGDSLKGPLAGKVIVVDPGHGGSDPGAVGRRGTLEKKVVLAVSLRLREALERRGATVVMTRADDRGVGLYDRAGLAGAAGADLFLSVHANWSPAKSIRGVEAYYYPGGAGRALAEAAARHLARRLGLPLRGAFPADFVVLRETRAPAALAEIGFLSNPAEEALLSDPGFQAEAAEALAEAAEEFLLPGPGGGREL